MKNPYIIPAAMICAAILAGFWILKSPSEPQKVVIVQPPQPPSISIRDAVFDENIESVKQYLDAGGDVNAEDWNGYTPLQLAAEYGRKEVAELLIAKGAYVNAKANGGLTPLVLAEEEKHTETADLLLKHGGKAGSEKHHISTFQFPI